MRSGKHAPKPEVASAPSPSARRPPGGVDPSALGVSPCFGYTLGMKTAVSLPDSVFRDAERLARRQKKSRSQLYRDALIEYVARHGHDEVTAQMDAVAADLPRQQDDFGRAAARRTVERSEW
jgi:hypothetical protein